MVFFCRWVRGRGHSGHLLMGGGVFSKKKKNALDITLQYVAFIAAEMTAGTIVDGVCRQCLGE